MDPGGKGMEDINRRGITPGNHPRLRATVAGVATVLALGIPASAAVAQSAAPLPPLPSSGGSPASAPPAGSGITAPVATPPIVTAPVEPPASLTMGARGSDVRALQRKLRLRGIGVPVDGAYGRTTRAGVRILQRRLRVPATGVADAALLARLGLKIRAVAGTPGPPATPTGPVAARYLKAFPVVGDYSYSDDFGDPRGQGPHQGNDIIGKMGTQLVSCVDGTISRLTRTETGLGGIWIWIVDGQGNEYYYAHMESISPEIKAGSRVTAGQPVGTMGMTGDARGTVPHLHFEIRPNGGGSINPFTELRAVDPRRR